jgi:hypothetical protein
MTNAAWRGEHLKDTNDFYADLQRGWLPAVAFIKPSGYVDGHPASSKLDLFEGFVRKIAEGVQAQPELWRDTATPLTARSRHNLPNPQAERDNPWVPANGPSLSDLFELFAFGRE